MRLADALRIRSGDIVTLVGGGGKTTVMFRLADELTAAGLTVISTMTTKIFVGQMDRAPSSLLLPANAGIPAELPALLARHRHVLLGGRIQPTATEPGQEKVEGVHPEVVDLLAAARLSDIVIIEGDGSRRLPFKAPAQHEPVVPQSTTVLVPLVGLDVLGQPLDQEHVHRPQLLSALVDAPLDEPITAQIVARVLGHPEGGAKGLPASARLVPLLNKADLQEGAGSVIARLLLRAGQVDEVVIAAAETAQPAREVWGPVAAVVLAAGEAKRFGRLKQVMPWRGTPLVAHVVEQALACPDIGDVIVTSGAQAHLVDAALAPRHEQITVVHVARWTEGQSRSVQTGLRSAMLRVARDRAARRLSAAMFLLADQPAITPALLSALVQRHRDTLAPVVAPRYNGRRGNPVLFDQRTFPEFDRLEGDAGARSIVQHYLQETAWVDWPTDEILRDIDTPEDYAATQQNDQVNHGNAQG